MNNRSDSFNPIQLLKDEPIEELERDSLGLKNWARVIAGIATGTQGPFTVGVFGSWGVGKTSVLKLAKKIIDHSSYAEQGKITTVLFNAWEYEKEDFPLVPLISSIVYELNQSDGLVKKAKQDAQKLHDALRSLLFGFSTNVKGKIPFFGEAGISLDSSKAIERYEALRSRWIDQQVEASLYYKAFETLRNVQLSQKGKSQHRVAVFIDDLDRCFPDKAIQLLESIKLVLHHPGFIFVLAVDPTTLENYLNKRYSQEFGLRHYGQGQSYLDKLIQLPLWIPSHEKRFDLLIETLLARPEMQEQQRALEPLVETLAYACEHNPRQLIRLLNDVLVAQKIYQLSRFPGEFPLNAFVVAHGIRHQSNLVYQDLLQNQSLCDKLKTCTDSDALQEMLMSLSVGRKDGKSSASLRRLQATEALIPLLVTAPAKQWLSNAKLRSRVDNFLAEGWVESRSNPDEATWIRSQVERALEDLKSPDQDTVIAACDILLALGDHNCVPALKSVRLQWKPGTKTGKVLTTTYQKLLLSYGSGEALER